MRINKNAVNFLSELPLFCNCGKDMLEAMLENDKAVIRSYEKNEEILRQNDENNCLAVVYSGQAVVKKSDVVIKNLDRGSIFGVSTLFADNSRIDTSISAARACEVILIPYEIVAQLVKSDCVFAENYIKFLSDKIQYLNSVIDRYTASGATQKISRFLKTSADMNGECFEVSMSRTAKQLNIGRASVYRAMDELSALGIIEKKGKTVRILNAEHLNNII